MKHSRILFSALVWLALGVGAGGAAMAQPDPNNVPKADNPDNREVRPRLTPEQREQQREEQRARLMKRQLERVGVTNAAQQKAVTEYIAGETEAQQELEKSSRALATALRGDAISDTQVAVLLNNYNVAIEDDRARRKRAQQKLDKSVNLNKAPRLQAFLTLMGLYGDAPSMGGNNWMRGR